MADFAESDGLRKVFRIVEKHNIPGRLSYTIATGKAKFGSDVVAPDVGPVQTLLVETRSGNSCYGCDGSGHAIASTQLIICAVANAIDTWIAPSVTPDKVLIARSEP
jgi:hypothetical protein